MQLIIFHQIDTVLQRTLLYAVLEGTTIPDSPPKLIPNSRWKKALLTALGSKPIEDFEKDFLENVATRPGYPVDLARTADKDIFCGLLADLVTARGKRGQQNGGGGAVVNESLEMGLLRILTGKVDLFYGEPEPQVELKDLLIRQLTGWLIYKVAVMARNKPDTALNGSHRAPQVGNHSYDPQPQIQQPQ